MPGLGSCACAGAAARSVNPKSSGASAGTRTEKPARAGPERRSGLRGAGAADEDDEAGRNGPAPCPAPMRQCANAPMRQCANAPMRQCANAPMRQCAPDDSSMAARRRPSQARFAIRLRHPAGAVSIADSGSSANRGSRITDHGSLPPAEPAAPRLRPWPAPRPVPPSRFAAGSARSRPAVPAPWGGGDHVPAVVETTASPLILPDESRITKSRTLRCSQRSWSEEAWVRVRRSLHGRCHGRASAGWPGARHRDDDRLTEARPPV